MKKKFIFLLLALTLVSTFISGCGKKEEASNQNSSVEDVPAPVIVVEDMPAEVIPEEPVIEEVEEEEPEEVREGFYRSELTHEWIDESLKDLRPIAAMVDNELTALPHYGTSQADVVYEMMNSTQNGRVTRLMCIFKDYNSIKQIGSIRSVRTTNLQIAPEYNAIVVHDGGPLYINAFFKNPFVDHLSGGFSRIDNGKSREFTEYITTGEITKRCESEGIDLNYNEYYQGPHWLFAKDSKPTDLSQANNAIPCTKIKLPYEHNKSKLEYIEETQTYRYSEYGSEYVDALTNEHMEFTNLILQECDFEQLDDHGYMNFFVHQGDNKKGYFITKGYAIPIVWAKNEFDMYPTYFFDEDLNMIQLNTGKTYVCIVPSDSWSSLVVE